MAVNVRLVHEFRFEAAHRLPCVAEEHKCARLHGHSFRVEVAVDGPVDPKTGWLVDFADIHRLWSPVHEMLDHRYLNEIAGLENPTSENLAVFIWRSLEADMPALARVTIFETCEARCEYEGR
jgi:6-pyruvoyltetrahydropterin/6-carboxytetrahydropterin synthase